MTRQEAFEGAGLIVCAAPIATKKALGSRGCRVSDCRRGESEPDDASNAAGIAYASGNRTDPAFIPQRYVNLARAGKDSRWVRPHACYSGEKVPDDRRARSAPCRALARRQALTHAGGAVSG
jgi:hypothetical protein